MKKEKFSRSLFGLDKKQIDKHLQMLKSDYEQVIRERDEEIEELKRQVQAYRDIETDIFEKREEIIQAMLRSQKEAKKIQVESQERLVVENKKLENIKLQIANCQKEAIDTMQKYIENIANFDKVNENFISPINDLMNDAIDNVKNNVFFEKISGEEIIKSTEVPEESKITSIEDLYEGEESGVVDEIARYKQEQELINMFELVSDISDEDEVEKPVKLPKHMKKTPAKSKSKVTTKTTTKATGSEKSTKSRGRPKKLIAV